MITHTSKYLAPGIIILLLFTPASFAKEGSSSFIPRLWNNITGNNTNAEQTKDTSDNNTSPASSSNNPASQNVGKQLADQLGQVTDQLGKPEQQGDNDIKPDLSKVNKVPNFQCIQGSARCLREEATDPYIGTIKPCCTPNLDGTFDCTACPKGEMKEPNKAQMKDIMNMLKKNMENMKPPGGWGQQPTPQPDSGGNNNDNNGNGENRIPEATTQTPAPAASHTMPEGKDTKPVADEKTKEAPYPKPPDSGDIYIIPKSVYDKMKGNGK